MINILFNHINEILMLFALDLYNRNLEINDINKSSKKTLLEKWINVRTKWTHLVYKIKTISNTMQHIFNLNDTISQSEIEYCMKKLKMNKDSINPFKLLYDNMKSYIVADKKIDFLMKELSSYIYEEADDNQEAINIALLMLFDAKNRYRQIKN